MDEFGDRSVTETLDTGNPSPDEIELEERYSSNTERIDFDEFRLAGRSWESWRMHLLQLCPRSQVSILLILFLMCVVAFRRVDLVSSIGSAV